ncbi:MAG: hypothetical protein ACI8YQ_003044 [Polaribacter sp.]|jgi:hypothetical protein
MWNPILLNKLKFTIMKKILKFLPLLLLATILFTSCNNDDADDTALNPLLDCPALELNIGDECIYTFTNPNGQTTTGVSIVNADCGLIEVMCFRKRSSAFLKILISSMFIKRASKLGRLELPLIIV